MNPDKLREIAGKLQQVFEEAGVEVEMFNLKIRVPREYYQSIKANFPDRHSIDMILGVGERDWSIDLLYSPTQSHGSPSEET
jgi:hypothetical protein